MAIKRVVLDRAAFFAALRKDNSGVFNRRLSQAQVEGTEAILDSAERNGVFDIDHVSQTLAHVYHETGTYMLGIKETVMPSHTNKRPADSTVIQRLDTAYASGKLTWVSTPYWRDGGFGRGPIQLTHWKNYLKMGTRLNLPLRENPDLALDARVGADIAVIGMSEGFFTGKKLSDYSFPAALEAPPEKHPRRIVNGKDGTDAKVSGYHRGFRKALEAGGYQVVEAIEIVADKINAGAIVAKPPVVIEPGLITTGSIIATSVEAKQPTPAPTALPSIWSWLAGVALKFVGERRV